MVAIGFMAVLLITATSTLAYATQNQSHTARQKADQLALSYAEAALARAYASVWGASDPRSSSAVADEANAVTVTFEHGTGTYYGTLSGTSWTLVGVGRVPNPTAGAADVVRTVRGRTSVGSGRRGSANNAVWNYIYVDDTSECTTLGNLVTINVPLYVRGNLCLKNSASVSSSAYALQVGGYLQFENNSTVGTSTGRLHEAHIGGGCRIGTTGPFTSPCGDLTRVYTEVPPDANPTGLTKPPVDIPHWYANADVRPGRACTEGSFPPGLDLDGTLNYNDRDVDIAPTYSYDCKVKDANGNLIGRIAWDHVAGKLSIAGTIFIDGNIAFRQQTQAVYEGRATIYASGRVSMNNQTMLCGVAECDNTWRPLENLLAFVAGAPTGNSIDAGNYTRFQGALYAVNNYTEGNNTEVWGPIIANKVYLQNSSRNFYVPIGTLLPGMPAEYDEVVVLSNEQGSWG